MSGFLFGAILLLVTGAWITLVYTQEWGDARPWRLILLSFLCAAPVLLFASIVILAFRAAPAGEYRVALEAVEVRLGAGELMTIGGGTEGDEADDVIVSDLPPRFLTFRVEGNQVVAELPDETGAAADEPRYAGVRVDRSKIFANSVSLAGQKNAVLHLPNGLDMTLDVDARTLVSQGAAWSTVPLRTQKIGDYVLPIARNLAADTVMYPLRYWARPSTSHDLATGADGQPLASFLSWEGGFKRGDLHLTLAGDGTTVTLGDGTEKKYERKIASFGPEESRRFALYRFDYSDPSLGEDSRSRAQERRSFRASYSGGRLAIVFDTPDIVRLSSASIARLVEHEKDKTSFLLATRDPERSAPIASGQMLLSFPQLGPRVQNEFYSIIRVAEGDDCKVRVTSHMGSKCHQPGDAFRIGDDAAAIVRFTKMNIPWGIVLTLLMLAFFSALWTFQHADATLAVIVISAAEILLAVRLLIAYEGALLDPVSASALWESLVAFAMVPYTLRVAWEMHRLREDTDPDLKGTAIRILLQCIAVVSLVAMALWQAHIDTAAIGMVCAAAVIGPLVVGWLAPRIVDGLTKNARRMYTIILFAAGIIALRLLMWGAAGWKERISFGSGAELAVTVVYLPLVFLFFAFAWERYRTASEARASTGRVLLAVTIIILGAVLTIAIPIVVKDSGSALVHVPAIALLFALPALVRPNWKKIIVALPLVGILAIHLGVLITPRLRGKDDVTAQNAAYQRALASPAEASKYLEERVQQSTNDLRVMSSIAPHQLEEAGTSKAEGLVMQRRMLDRYGGRKLFGAGYLNVPLALFRDTHLNDNLSAIHIMAPFGAAGALGIVALLAALALLPLVLASASWDEAEQASPEAALDQRTALGTMALWTFSICGIYMFAANLGLVLFTGKNVYLLAASSKSDAIEGTVLLLLALLALSPLHKEEASRAAEPDTALPETTSQETLVAEPVA